MSRSLNRVTRLAGARLGALLLLLACAAAAQAPFSYTVSNGTVTITGYNGPGPVATVPGTVNGLPVTRIGDEVFYGCTNLTGIAIPASVTTIGNWAFYDCASLTNLTIGNHSATIGEWAFYRCLKLTSVTLGTNVVSVGNWAPSQGHAATNRPTLRTSHHRRRGPSIP